MGFDVGEDSGPCPRCKGKTVVESFDETPWGDRGNYMWCCETCGSFSQHKDPNKPHSEYVFQADFMHNAAEPRKSCPCLHINPCGPACSCAHMGMSGGCKRCASYGSPEQQKEAATRIATAIEQYELDLLLDRTENRLNALDSMIEDLSNVYGTVSITRDELRGVTTDMMFLDEVMHIDGALLGDGKQLVMGIDFATEPSVTVFTHAQVGPNGEVLYSEPVSGPSVIQCICCVAGGDEEKKVCEFRTDTGIEEGWWCEECYQDWQNNGQP